MSAITSDDPRTQAHEIPARLAGDSVAVIGWTLVSRLTGFARVIVVAAVLGPSYLGNTFQVTNTIPNLTFELLTGSLFASLIVPPLVRALDRGDLNSVKRLADNVLGLVVLAFTVTAVVVVLAGPIVLAVVAIGVPDASTASDQRAVGWELLALLMPQVIFYGIAGAAGAAQNALGRFAIAAAAPAVENVGVIVTMLAVLLAYGTDVSLGTVSQGELLMLGLGTTAAVAVHAAMQWWGARRAGITIVPRAGWRDADVRALGRQSRSALGYAGLNAMRIFAALVVANAIPGGVVVFGIALAFLYLPVAVGARPLAVAALPVLARLHARERRDDFRTELDRCLSRALFLTIPAAVAYVVLAVPLARAVAFGEMSTSRGIELLTLSLIGLAAGVVGEAAFVVLTHAAFARNDARSPLRSMVVRTATSLVGMTGAVILFDDGVMLLMLGLSLSLGNVVSAWHLGRRIGQSIPARPRGLPVAAALRALGASLAMAGPAYGAAFAAHAAVGGHAGAIAGVVAAIVVGAAVFLTVQHAIRSAELAFFVGAYGRASRAVGTT